MALVEEKEKANKLQHDEVATGNTSSAKLQRFLKDATERSASLQKTISFHQQYQTAFIETANYLEEIERRLESVGSDSFTDQIVKLQVCVQFNTWFCEFCADIYPFLIKKFAGCLYIWVFFLAFKFC